MGVLSMVVDADNRRAWLIILASSSASCFGSFIVWGDAIWNKLSGSRYSILDDTGFLVMSLGLSGGILVTTSLNSLLPKALEYIEKSRRYTDDKVAKRVQLISYVLGIVTCLVLNFLVHVMTSQSVVHCAHENAGPSGDSDPTFSAHKHSHIHGHDHGEHGRVPDPSSHAHSHSEPAGQGATGHQHNHDDAAQIPGKKDDTDPKKTLKPRRSRVNFFARRSYESISAAAAAMDDDQRSTHSYVNYNARESTPLLEAVPEADMSVGHMSQSNHLKQHFTIISRPSVLNLKPGTQENTSLIDRTSRMLVRGNGSCVGSCRGFQTLQSCAAETHRDLCCAPEDVNVVGGDAPAPQVYYEHEQPGWNLEVEEELELHHHHVVSKYSHLFSIGLQTALAVSLHKIPEGLMLYATNKADSAVGFRVFFALAIHNVFEGFTIAAPLYLALRSRTWAVLGACLLGGGSQPLGALLAMELLPNLDENKSSFLQFGVLVAGTAGFMAFIAVQMLATAVTFGGSQQKVVTWCIIGTCVVLGMQAL